MHAVKKFFGVAAVRSRHCIGAVNDFQSRDFQRALHQIGIQRQRFLHGGKALFGVTVNPNETLLVLQIVVDHQPDLRIEECAVLGHGAQIIVGGEGPVFHHRATGFGCGRHCGPISMHRRA